MLDNNDRGSSRTALTHTPSRNGDSDTSTSESHHYDLTADADFYDGLDDDMDGMGALDMASVSDDVVENTAMSTNLEGDDSNVSANGKERRSSSFRRLLNRQRSNRTDNACSASINSKQRSIDRRPKNFSHQSWIQTQLERMNNLGIVRLALLGLTVIMFSLTIAYIVVKVPQKINQKNNSDGSQQPTDDASEPRPTPEEESDSTLRADSIRNVLTATPGSQTDVSSLLDTTTPQSYAYSWILFQDARRLEPTDPTLMQRFTLATLYFATKGDGQGVSGGGDEAGDGRVGGWINSTGWLGGESECSWHGVRCITAADAAVSQLPPRPTGGEEPAEESSGPLHGATGTRPTEALPPPGDYNKEDGRGGGARRRRARTRRVLRSVDGTEKGDLHDDPAEITASPFPPGGLGAVSSLYMTSNNLVGSLPPELGSLTFLEEMFLGSNSIYGAIETSIGTLAALEVLSLHDNLLSGTMPEEIGDASSLIALDVRNNKLHGEITDSLGHLTNLVDLMIGYNEFTGTIPQSVCDLNIHNFGSEFLVSLPKVDCSCCLLTTGEGMATAPPKTLRPTPRETASPTMSPSTSATLSPSTSPTVSPSMSPPSSSSPSTPLLPQLQRPPHIPDLEGSGEGDGRLGSSLSLSDDGTRLAVVAGVSAVTAQEQGDSGGRGGDAFVSLVPPRNGHILLFDYSAEVGSWEPMELFLPPHVGSSHGGNQSLAAEEVEGEEDDKDKERPEELVGFSVSLSGDGSRLAIGVMGSDPTTETGADVGGGATAVVGNKPSPGYVRVYESPDDSSSSQRYWKQIGNDIVESLSAQEDEAVDSGVYPGGWFGFAVALSRDGKRLAVGEPRSSSGDGSVSLFEYDNEINGQNDDDDDDGDWRRLGMAIGAEDEAANFGWSVALSSDGDVVAAGAPLQLTNEGSPSSRTGYVGVFRVADGTLEPDGALIDSTEGGDLFGYSVSLSEDGKFLAIGAPQSDTNGNNSGSATVWRDDGGAWNLYGGRMEGSGGDNAGFSVALSADGHTALVGAPGHAFSGPPGDKVAGYAKVFGIRNETWLPLDADFSGSEPGDAAGHSVSISSNGSVAVVGSPMLGSSGPGYVRTIHLATVHDAETFFMQIPDLNGEKDEGYFGSSVALSDDGNRLAIVGGGGGIVEGEAAAITVQNGIVLLHEYNSRDGVWEAMNFLLDDNEVQTSLDDVGYSVSLAGNGQRIAVGGTGDGGDDDGSTGNTTAYVRVYEYRDPYWEQVGSDIVVEYTGIDAAASEDNVSGGGWFGFSVALSRNGGRLAVGEPWSNLGDGGVSLFEYGADEWTRLGVARGAEGEAANFGWSVALSSDGDVVAGGAPQITEDASSSLAGYVGVFRVVNGVLQPEGDLIDSTEPGDLFGHSIAISHDGTHLVVGAPRSSTNGIDSGSASVWRNGQGMWKRYGTEIGGSGGDIAGFSVALAGDGQMVVVGAPGQGFMRGGSENHGGYIMVYGLLNHTWTQIDADFSGSELGDRAGHSVSLSWHGIIAVVGAPMIGSSGRGYVRTIRTEMNSDAKTEALSPADLVLTTPTPSTVLPPTTSGPTTLTPTSSSPKTSSSVTPSPTTYTPTSLTTGVPISTTSSPITPAPTTLSPSTSAPATPSQTTSTPTFIPTGVPSSSYSSPKITLSSTTSSPTTSTPVTPPPTSIPTLSKTQGPTSLPTTCAFIRNGDFEDGHRRGWNSLDSTLSVIEHGKSGDNWVLSSSDRTKWTSGFTQDIDKSCLSVGKTLEVTATFKLLDKNDNPYGCDLAVKHHDDPELCTILRIFSPVDDDEVASSQWLYNNAGISWEASKWNYFQASFVVTEDMMKVDSTRLIVIGPKSGVTILMDDLTVKETTPMPSPSPTTLDTMCQDLIVNGEVTHGTTDGWFPYVSEINVRKGRDGQGWAIESSNRNAWGNGVYQILNQECIVPGQRWKINAKLKLLNENGIPFVCDLAAVRESRKACPIVWVLSRTITAGLVYSDYVSNDYKGKWENDSFFEFQGELSVVEEMVAYEWTKLLIVGPRAGVTMLIDDFSVTKVR